MIYKTNFQRKKQVVDEAFSNGFNWTRAYMTIMGVEKPEMAKRAVYRMKQSKEVEDYITFKESEIQMKYAIDKDKIIRELVDLIEECKNETARDRNNLIKGIDMINKMFGYYTPEKHEHKHEGITINIIKPNKDTDGD
jgi:hypothetical protein